MPRIGAFTGMLAEAVLLECGGGVVAALAGEVGEGALKDYTAAKVAAFRSHIYYPVSRLDHICVVLHHYYGVAVGDESVEGLHKIPDVVGVEACCWLVEDEESCSVAPIF